MKISNGRRAVILGSSNLTDPAAAFLVVIIPTPLIFGVKV